MSLTALAGGVAFSIAQQIRMPHRPGLLDIPAFAIMVVADPPPTRTGTPTDPAERT